MILLNKLFSTKKSAKGRVDYPLLLLGAVIYGVSVGLVLSPNEIAPGGASGLAVMLSRFLPLGVGSLTMAINLPLLAVSLYVFGWRFLVGTVIQIPHANSPIRRQILLSHSKGKVWDISPKQRTDFFPYNFLVLLPSSLTNSRQENLTIRSVH